MRKVKVKNPIVRLMKAKNQADMTVGKDCYEPDITDLRLYYNLLNRYVFKGVLRKPKLEVKRLCGAWGIFFCNHVGSELLFKESSITMNNRFPTKQLFVAALAHEMVHQYQWEVSGPRRIKEGLRPTINHGPNFLEWRDTLGKFGIPLQRQY